MGGHIGLPGRPREVASAAWQQAVEIDDCLIQNPAYSFARIDVKDGTEQVPSFLFYRRGKVLSTKYITRRSINLLFYT